MFLESFGVRVYRVDLIYVSGFMVIDLCCCEYIFGCMVGVNLFYELLEFFNMDQVNGGFRCVELCFWIGKFYIYFQEVFVFSVLGLVVDFIDEDNWSC